MNMHLYILSIIITGDFITLHPVSWKWPGEDSAITFKNNLIPKHVYWFIRFGI